MDRDRCAAVIQRIAEVAQRHQGKGINEHATRNALIEPILGIFGWPKEDLDRVQPEYRHTTKVNPVDYALMVQGRPVVLVEAKALDVPANDPRFVSQVLSYANMAGAEWAILTNGLRWDLYAVLGKGDYQNKRIFSVALGDPDFIEWMSWIAPDRVEGSELDRFWRLLVSERTVKATVTRLFQERTESLVQLLAVETGLDGTDVATAIQTLRISFEGPSMAGRLQILDKQAAEPLKVVYINPPVEVSPLPIVPPPVVQPPVVQPHILPQPRVVQFQELAEPEPGRKPATFSIGDRTWKVATWRDTIIKAAEFMYEWNPDAYRGIFTDPLFHGRRRIVFMKEAEGMTFAMEIPEGFAEGNQSAASSVRIVNKMLHYFQVDLVAAYTVQE